jgi:5-(carboxyamino)imidazole ribonucleotide synthase
MVNLIGAPPPTERVLEVPGAHLHLYGKASRPGRKIGHVTVTGEDSLEGRTVRIAALAGAG